MIYITLFLEFFKIGLFAIGGGLATLPFLQDLTVKYDWITAKQLIDMIAISESTPGPIGINTATFVGFEAGGLLGGISATLGIVAPSIIVIIVIAHFFAKFSETKTVKSAFIGIRAAVAGLIGSVFVEIFLLTIFNINKFNITNKLLDLINLNNLILFGAMFYITHKYKKHPIFYLAIAAVIGIIFKF